MMLSFHVFLSMKNGSTALMHACARGHMGTAAMLLRRGAQVDTLDKVGVESPLSLSLSQHRFTPHSLK
jgi:ankyrin repeat protein